MGKTIDERVVEMRFDNQNFEKNIKTSMSSLDKLKEKLNFKGASDSFEKLGKAAGNVDMSPLGRSIDDIKNKFSMLEAIAVGGMMRIGQKAADTGIQLAKSLSVDQISAGWDKFAQKTTSVATLISQGYDMSEVEEQLSRLNWFTDETSYIFTDMVSNIAKFTATGKKLNESVTAMEGIANWAALSGQNAVTASRAMYQLSQAMGAGVMRLEDYKAIQNASMDTDEFRQICLDTAVALGTLRANADGTYNSLMTAGKGAEAFTKAQFTTKLTEGVWLTGDVMMAVFNKYSSAVSQIYEYAEEKGITASEAIEELNGKVDEFGLKAFLSAQEAKTFGDAIDSVKDAVSTGWMNTFELIFGNYEKQRVLWTELANRMYDVFAGSGEIRNEILQQWNDLGGQDKLVETFWTLWDKIAEVVKPIKDAFREIFPRKTAQDLYNITLKLEQFVNSLKMSDETLNNFKMTFKGAFAAISIVKQILSGLFTLLKPLFSGVSQIGSVFISLTGSIGKFLVKIDETAKKTNSFVTSFQKIKTACADVGEKIANSLDISIFDKIRISFSQIASILSELIHKIGNFISSLINSFTSSGFITLMFSIWNLVTQIFSGVGNIFSKGLLNVVNYLSNANFDNIIDLINVIISGGLALGAKKMFGSIGDAFGSVKRIGKSVKQLLDGLKDSLKAWQDQLKAKTLLTIAAAIGVLSVSLLIISSIDSDKLLNSFAAITGLFSELLASMTLFNLANEKFRGKGNAIISLLGIVVAVSILATAMKRISSISWDELAIGLTGISVLLGLVIGFTKIMASDKKNKVAKGALQILIFSEAVKVLASACKAMSDLSWEGLAKGLVGVGILLAEIVGFSRIMNSSKHMMSSAIGIIGIAAALRIIVSVVEELAFLSWDEIARGFAGIAAVLVSVASAMNLLPKGMTSKGLGLIAVATALVMLGSVIQKLGNMEWESIGKAASMLAGSLLLIAGGLQLMRGTLKGSAALIVAATALAIFTPVLFALGNMSWESILKSLVAIASVFAVLGVSGLLLGPIIPVILGLSGSLVLLGIGMSLVGAGALALGIGISALAGAITATASMIVSSLTIIIVGIINIIPSVIKIIEEAIVSFYNAIANSAKAIGNAVKAIVLEIISILIECVPDLVDCALTLIGSLLVSLTEYAPSIIESLLEFVMVVLKGFLSKLPELLPILFEISDAIRNAFKSTFSTGNMLTALFTTDIFLCIVKDLKQIKKNAKDAIVGAGVMVLVFGMIAGVIYLCSLMPTDQMVTIAATLTGTIAVLAAVVYALSNVSVGGAISALEAFAIFVGGLVAILAILGGLNQIPGFSWLMDEGIKVMAQIGTALGALVGGIIGGIGLGMSSSLPAIGDNLTKFMENSEGFLSRLENLDDGVLENAKAFAETIIILTAAELMDSVSKFLSFGGFGTDYYTELGDRLEKFGDGINRFVNAVGDVDSDTVQKAADAGLVMANLAKEIPSSGTSVLSIIMGNKDLGVFGEQLEKFGEGLKKFSDSIEGINTKVVENAASASMTLAELARSIPNNGDSILKWVTGEKNLENFGYQLSMFGASLMLFQDSVTDLNPGVVEKAATAGTLLSDLANSIPTQGGAFNDWFFGNKDMSVFGAQLAAFGGGIRDFVSAIAMPTYTEDVIDGTYFSALANIDEAVDAAEAILTIGAKVQELAPKDDSGIFDFVTAFSALNSLVESAAQEANLNNLKTLGGVIKDFSISLEGARMDLLNDSVPALNALGEILALLPNISFTNLEGISIEGFDDLGTQIISFYYQIADMDFSALTRGNSIFKKFIELLNELTGVNFTSISDLNYVIQQVCQMCEDIGASAAQFDLKVQNVTGDQLAEDVQKVIDMVGPLGQLSLKLRYIDLSGFDKVTDEEGSSLFGRLGTDLASFANNMVTFCASMEGIAGDVVQNYIGELNQIVTSMKTLSENAKTNVDWSGMQEFSDSLVSLGTEGIKGLIDTLSGVDSKNDLHDAVIALFANGKQGIEDSKEPLRSATSSVISGCVEEIKSRGNDFNNAAKELMKKVVTGIRTYAGPVKEAIRELISGARERAMSMANTFTLVGSRMASAIGTGFLNEIERVKAQIESEIEELSNIASTGVSVSTSQSYPETPYRGPSSNNNRSSITPVKTSGNRGLKSGLRSNQVMSMSNSTHLARTISVGMSKESTTQNQNGNGGSGNTYTFTQNNYSPKALSRTDIYRQTQNQFAVMKGTV